MAVLAEPAGSLHVFYPQPPSPPTVPARAAPSYVAKTSAWKASVCSTATMQHHHQRHLVHKNNAQVLSVRAMPGRAARARRPQGCRAVFRGLLFNVRTPADLMHVLGPPWRQVFARRDRACKANTEHGQPTSGQARKEKTYTKTPLAYLALCIACNATVWCGPLVSTAVACGRTRVAAQPTVLNRSHCDIESLCIAIMNKHTGPAPVSAVSAAVGECDLNDLRLHCWRSTGTRSVKSRKAKVRMTGSRCSALFVPVRGALLGSRHASASLQCGEEAQVRSGSLCENRHSHGAASYLYFLAMRPPFAFTICWAASGTRRTVAVTVSGVLAL